MNIVSQIIANGLIAGSLYALLAIGFNLIYGTVRFFDLGYGALTAVGGFVMFTIFTSLGFPMALGVLVSLLASGVIGWIIYLIVYKPMRKRQATSTVILVASLGVFTVMQAILAIIFSSQFKTLARHVGGQPVFTIAGASVTLTQVIIFSSVIVVSALVSLLLFRTKIGKAIRAIGDDEEVAKIVGINTTKVVGLVFFIGSIIAGLAGILVGFDTGIEPTMGLALLLKAVVAAIIGGVGNIFGGILGAYLLGLVENVGIWHISGEWKDAIAFALLILFLLFRPYGLFGSKPNR